MFELELHDVILYFISISLLCSVAFAYASHLQTDVHEYWARNQVVSVLVDVLPALHDRSVPIQHWLATKVKRKESPDDDITECSASFVQLFSNKRGGLLCGRTMYSLHL